MPTFDIILSSYTQAALLTLLSAIGAGDTFIAGALFGALARDMHPLAKNLQFAVDLATLKVQRDGFTDLGKDITVI